MSKRYGRNQKRQAKELEKALYSQIKELQGQNNALKSKLVTALYDKDNAASSALKQFVEMSPELKYNLQDAKNEIYHYMAKEMKPVIDHVYSQFWPRIRQTYGIEYQDNLYINVEVKIPEIRYGFRIAK